MAHTRRVPTATFANKRIRRVNRVLNTREQRRAQRKRVNFTVPVINVMTEREFGQLGDLSASGMLIISTHAPRNEGVYQLRLALPGLGTRTRYIEVGVQERWHDVAPANRQIWAGYRIIAMREEDIAQLDAWLALPG